MTLSDAGADQDWGRLIDVDEAEREAAMLQRYVALAALPEEERRQQLRAMATAEYALPDAALRTFTRSRLRAWLGMDAEAARRVAASYDAVMREMPATTAMRRITSAVALAGAGLGVVTLTALVLDPVIQSPAVAGWLYLLVVLPVTLRWGRGAGLATAALAGLLLLGLLVEPRFAFDAADSHDDARLALCVGGMMLAALLIDAANRRRLAAERRLAVQQEREQAHRLALAGIAHDLGQPLTALAIATQLLQRGGEGIAPQRRDQLLGDVAVATARLRRMMADWLALARGTGNPDVVLQPVDPRPLLEAAAHQYGDRIAGGITLNHPPVLPWVQADPFAVERVLGNLLSNSAKYGVGPVVLAAAEDGGMVHISVLDRGPGLPPGATAHLFQAFSRGEGAEARAQGYGLGLAIAAMLVHAHGGRIWAENRPDGGAAFHFTVPVAPEGADGDRAELQEPHPASKDDGPASIEQAGGGMGHGTNGRHAQ